MLYVTYIADFIVFRLEKKIKCSVCVSSILGNKLQFDCSLISQKTRGGLSYPTADVIKITEFCEKVFRTITKNNKQNLVPLLLTEVLTNFIGVDLFSSFNLYMFDTTFEYNHYILLIKAIAEEY